MYIVLEPLPKANFIAGHPIAPKLDPNC
jgi:hypothetical protein